jgi:hypothetical protein
MLLGDSGAFLVPPGSPPPDDSGLQQSSDCFSCDASKAATNQKPTFDYWGLKPDLNP